jgi:hypothetical protein
MAGTNALNSLIAAELSLASYTPLGEYAGTLTNQESLDSSNRIIGLPVGWSFDPANSGGSETMDRSRWGMD